MNYFPKTTRNCQGKKRTVSVLENYDKTYKNIEKLPCKRTLKVERLMSLNIKNLGNLETPIFKNEKLTNIRQPLSNRRLNLNIKLDSLNALESSLKFEFQQTQNYWAKLAYRQSLLNSDRQYQNI